MTFALDSGVIVTTTGVRLVSGKHVPTATATDASMSEQSNSRITPAENTSSGPNCTDTVMRDPSVSVPSAVTVPKASRSTSGTMTRSEPDSM